MAQTPEVVEGYHPQVRPRENVRQLLADGFEDAHPGELLDAFGKRFFLALGFLSLRMSTSKNLSKPTSRSGSLLTTA